MGSVLEIVERSNQRGGRMLSVIDLIAAGTLSLSQTAWLLRRIEEGASWLVGARPGGAGKTAVMSALLAMLPKGETVRLTNPAAGWERSGPRDCLVAYEISPGAYDAYIWGDDVRRFFALGAAGCRLVSNLHADTLEEAREQIVAENGVAPGHFGAVNLFLPIRLAAGPRSGRREIPVIHYFCDGAWRAVEEPDPLSGHEQSIARALQDWLGRGLRTVAEVRAAWLAWRTENPDRETPCRPA